jgi:hypothetical protein
MHTSATSPLQLWILASSLATFGLNWMHPLEQIGNSSVHRPVARQRDHEPSDQAASLSRHKPLFEHSQILLVL